MNARRRIRIFFDPARADGLRQYRRPGWAWECPCCTRARADGRRIGGRHAYDRFTDQAKPGRTLHPFQRCWDAVELHLWRHHRKK